MYNPVRIANKFVALAVQAGESLTHMQLQKLTYIAHGYFLALTDSPLLNEPVSAWKYGPVIPGMYDSFKVFGNRGIPAPVNAVQDNLDPKAEAVIEAVYRIYGKNDGITLSELTHRPGTPWCDTYNGRQSSTVISNEAIQTYYKNLMSKQGQCNGL
ncbi:MULTISPECIES: Panacea domain-containing protein [unclassified Serratia (in: enterobacteria)]|uniref:Panacea domain-containing protein n=1 Tax=unclassified Serratia (in: enterobacteria) TaxID=2647522 RepID=UPI003B43600A